MKNLFLIFFCIVLSTRSFGQELSNSTDSASLKNAIQKNTIFIEAFGTAAYYSINYDRILKNGEKYKTSIRGGLLILPTKNLSAFGVPVEYDFLIGKTKHFFELGLGLSYIYVVERVNVTEHYDSISSISYTGTNSISMLSFTGRIGYRFQKPDGGFFWRISFTPLIPLLTDGLGKSKKVEYFPNISFFPPVLPWGGLGIGYTLK